ncbi:hypothetical protein Tco_0578282 [Tanacetum coccineum]
MANNETECSPSEVCLSDSDSELLIPTPWSDESKNEKKGKNVERRIRIKKDPCLRLTLRKQSGDLVEMPSEAVEQGMDDHVPDEIDGAKCEQFLNHVVKKLLAEIPFASSCRNRRAIDLAAWLNLLRARVPPNEQTHGIKRRKRWNWCDSELEIKWYMDHLYEMHLFLNLSQREELENELTSREELAVLQVEFTDMEGQMQQLMEELKKSQKNAFFFKSTAIVFGVVASFMFVMN